MSDGARVVIFALLGLLLVALLAWVRAGEAAVLERACAFCVQARCQVAAECGPGCVCLKSGMGTRGRCVSFEVVR